jgi:glycosyltransferase involved in cell wall biosynthesis
MKTLFSIIMPALNEENRIDKALNSIRNQSVNQDEIEILVIDGGSTDRTRKIAESYGARVLDNPKVLPEDAKGIGLRECTGKYIVFLDADEEFTHKDQLARRIALFQSDDELKGIITNGLLTPLGFPSLTRYANNCGDPFSYFAYRFDAENLVSSLDKKRYSYTKHGEYGRIYSVGASDYAPIGDGGATTIDYEYLKANFSDRLADPVFSSTRFNEIVNKTGRFGIVENDSINHYTTVYLKTYLNKLKFRIILNLNSKDEKFGYTARAHMNKKLRNRRYFFLLYCLFPPAVLVDSIVMSLRKRCSVFLLHFVFVYYVFFQIAWCTIKKIAGVNLTVDNYGK